MCRRFMVLMISVHCDAHLALALVVVPMHIQKREVTLAIRFYNDGALSRRLRHLRVGDEVDISGPFDGVFVSGCRRGCLHP